MSPNTYAEHTVRTMEQDKTAINKKAEGPRKVEPTPRLSCTRKYGQNEGKSVDRQRYVLAHEIGITEWPSVPQSDGGGFVPRSRELQK